MDPQQNGLLDSNPDQYERKAIPEMDFGSKIPRSGQFFNNLKITFF
jgi:hypothetical protein